MDIKVLMLLTHNYQTNIDFSILRHFPSNSLHNFVISTEIDKQIKSSAVAKPQGELNTLWDYLP
jgi:hypothetical protein